MVDRKAVTIVKIMATDNVGFKLIPILDDAPVEVHPANANSGPHVHVKRYGDRRTQDQLYYPITGDVTIMNGDGVVLSEVSYEKLMAAVRAQVVAEETCSKIKEAMGLGPMPTWDEVNDALRARPPEYPSSVQGSESRQAFNATSEDAHFDKGYSYDLFAELFGSSVRVVEMALATYHRNHPGVKYKIYHRKEPTKSGVIGYLEADEQMIFAIFESEAKDLIGLPLSYLASYDLVKEGGGRIMLQSGEGVTAFITPRCGNGFTPLRTRLDPAVCATPIVVDDIDDVAPTAIETRYSERNRGIRFIPSPGYDEMDQFIKRGHALTFARMFGCLVDTPPNGTWYLYLNGLGRDNSEVLGIMTVSSVPHLIVLKEGLRAVDGLTAKEKQRYGLKHLPNVGWTIEDYHDRRVFSIRLINGRIWDISVPTVY